MGTRHYYAGWAWSCTNFVHSAGTARNTPPVCVLASLQPKIRVSPIPSGYGGPPLVLNKKKLFPFVLSCGIMTICFIHRPGTVLYHASCGLSKAEH